MRFSVVIPVFNEETTISRCISQLIQSSHDVEILVVDGGSHDATRQIARATGARVLHSPAGRGPQMNIGARESSGTILVFLHADSIVPPVFFDFLSGQFSHPGLQFGAFRALYEPDSFLLRVYSFFTQFESALTTFGDQCFVMRREFFLSIGGFPEWPLFEDVEFLRRARKVTVVRKFHLQIKTSARKFLNGGVVVQQLHNIVTMILFRLGVPPRRLYKRYYGRDLNDRGASTGTMGAESAVHHLREWDPVRQANPLANTDSARVGIGKPGEAADARRLD